MIPMTLCIVDMFPESMVFSIGMIIPYSFFFYGLLRDKSSFELQFDSLLSLNRMDVSERKLKFYIHLHVLKTERRYTVPIQGNFEARFLRSKLVELILRGKCLPPKKRIAAEEEQYTFTWDNDFLNPVQKNDIIFDGCVVHAKRRKAEHRIVAKEMSSFSRSRLGFLVQNPPRTFPKRRLLNGLYVHPRLDVEWHTEEIRRKSESRKCPSE